MWVKEGRRWGRGYYATVRCGSRRGGDGGGVIMQQLDVGQGGEEMGEGLLY